MTDRPRLAVIVYGSFLHPDDLAELFDDVQSRVVPVEVRDFDRRFNQEASWRETDGDRKAVLNVTPASDEWFNGILVADLSREEFREFRERERGYRLIEVDSDAIERYDRSAIETDRTVNGPDIESQDLVLTTTGLKTRDSIDPIDSYVDLCYDGASQWGVEFLQDFLRTTKLTTGEALKSYRSE
jgi:hypothetical protein